MNIRPCLPLLISTDKTKAATHIAPDNATYGAKNDEHLTFRVNSLGRPIRAVVLPAFNSSGVSKKREDFSGTGRSGFQGWCQKEWQERVLPKRKMIPSENFVCLRRKLIQRSGHIQRDYSKRAMIGRKRPVPGLKEKPYSHKRGKLFRGKKWCGS